jgi:hypothetical protein
MRLMHVTHVTHVTRRARAVQAPRRTRRAFAMLAGAIALAAMAVGGSSTHADRVSPGGALVRPPAGWRTDPEQATALAQRFAAASHLGGLPVATAAEAYVADRPGIALFATRATATLADPAQAAQAGQATQAGPAAQAAQAAQAGKLARAALDELRASTRRAALSGGAAKEGSWQERVEPASRQVVATLTWSDPANTVGLARIVVASDGARVAAVTGECLASEPAPPALIAACREALATLDPGVPVAARIALVPAAADATGANAGPATDAEPASRARAPARLDDGSRIAFPPMVIPQEPRAPARSDNRTVYVGAGILALALMFWWNRRRRDRFDREERGAPPAPSRAAAPAEPDEDAADLHAAARGDRPEEPNP